MIILSKIFSDVRIAKIGTFKDSRGKFSRLFCQKELSKITEKQSIKQINLSTTEKKGTLRGLHFQHPPMMEAKFVHCLKGTVFDVMIDLRSNSPSFLKWHGEILVADDMKLLFIPKGFAHGFLTLKDKCEMLYLHTEFYSPNHEGGIRFDDPMIGIEWPIGIVDISERDKRHPYLKDDYKGLEP